MPCQSLLGYKSDRSASEFSIPSRRRIRRCAGLLNGRYLAKAHNHRRLLR